MKSLETCFISYKRFYIADSQLIFQGKKDSGDTDMLPIFIKLVSQI